MRSAIALPAFAQEGAMELNFSAGSDVPAGTRPHRHLSTFPFDRIQRKADRSDIAPIDGAGHDLRPLITCTSGCVQTRFIPKWLQGKRPGKLSLRVPSHTFA